MRVSLWGFGPAVTRGPSDGHRGPSALPTLGEEEGGLWLGFWEGGGKGGLPLQESLPLAPGQDWPVGSSV